MKAMKDQVDAEVVVVVHHCTSPSKLFLFLTLDIRLLCSGQQPHKPNPIAYNVMRRQVKPNWRTQLSKISIFNLTMLCNYKQ